MQKAVFAGGCFWCVEAEFAGIDGVSSVMPGYTGGTAQTATYEQVSTGDTDHVEAVEVAFDPAKVSYDKLLEIFWGNVDPFDEGGQFCDRGSQYAAGIFYADDGQKKAAEASRAAMEKKFGRRIATFIRPALPFYAAEDYHREYYKKNALRYQMYKKGCGRDDRLEEIRERAE